MRLSKNFDSSEFACSCCGTAEMNPEFIARLQVARDIAGIPFIITSGFRCKAKNDSIPGSSKTSEHMTGEAADIYTPDSSTRDIILGALFAAGFPRKGVGEDFLHAGTGKDKAQNVTWRYKDKPPE